VISWGSYPKVFAIGHAAVANIFDDPVIVEEKIDGSQFSFGIYDGVLRVRSKGVEMDPGRPEAMFELAVNSVKSRLSKLSPGWRYVCEYLAKPKHNTLAYERIPNGHLVLLDVLTARETYLSYEQKQNVANSIGLECVPKLGGGKYTTPSEIFDFLECDSILGGQKVEGVVVKNYSRFGKDGKAMLGKYVSEKFKEIHTKDWKIRNPTQNDIVEKITDQLRTVPRWEKAVQHLREAGKLENSPKDIGALIKEIWNDWIVHRKKSHKSVYHSAKYEQKAMNELKALSKDNEAVAIKIVEQSIIRDWKGFFNLDSKNDSQQEPQRKKFIDL